MKFSSSLSNEKKFLSSVLNEEQKAKLEAYTNFEVNHEDAFFDLALTRLQVQDFLDKLKEGLDREIITVQQAIRQESQRQ